MHAAVVPKLARELAGHGLPLAWYDVLLVLNAAPGRKLRMTELGAPAVLSRERVSRVVGELEEPGWSAGSRTPTTGGRATPCSPRGPRRLRAAAPTYLAGIEQHYSRYLETQEVRVITRALGRVLAAEEVGAADLPPRARPARRR